MSRQTKNLHRKFTHNNQLYNPTLEAMYAFPAKKEYALLHMYATRFAFKNLQRSNEEKDVNLLKCPCCDNYIFNQEYPMSTHTYPATPEKGKDIFLMPAGVAMYFKFVKIVIYHLVLRFFMLDLYTIYSSIYGNYCADVFRKGGTDICTFTVSLINLKTAQDQQFLPMLDYLSTVFVLASMVYFYLFRKSIQRYYSWMDNCLDVTQDNYSIFLQNIPLPEEISEEQGVQYDEKWYKKAIKEEIIKKINEWFNKISKIIKKAEVEYKKNHKFVLDPNQKITIVESQLFSLMVNKSKDIEGEAIQDLIEKVILCYDLNIYENSVKLRDKIINNYLNELDSDLMERSRFQAEENEKGKVKNKINKVNQKIIKHSQQSVGNKSLSFIGKAFVTFRYQPFRSYFLSEYRKDNNFMKIAGNSIKISPANRPQQIYWNNLKVSDDQRKVNLFHSYSILFLLLFVSFALLLLMEIWQISKNTDNHIDTFANKLLGLLVSMSMSITIHFINYVLGYSIERLSNMQKHKATTYRTGSLIFKMVVSQTINTLGIYYFLSMIRPFNFLGNFGLVSRIQGLITFSSIFSLLVNAIPFDKIKKRVLDFICCRREVQLFQIELNKRYEYKQFNFTQKYAYYIVFTYTISFYGVLVPTATFIQILAFVGVYWLDKYNVYKRSSNNINIDFFTIKASLALLELSLFVYIIGYIIWDTTIHFDSDNWFKLLNFSALLVIVLYLLLSYKMDYAEEAEWNEEYCVNKNAYRKYLPQFNTTYDLMNPPTAFKSNKKEYFKEPYLAIDREFYKWENGHRGYSSYFEENKKNENQDEREQKWRQWIEQHSDREVAPKYKEDDVTLFEECFKIRQIEAAKLIENMVNETI